jgi:hypothetical protein
MKGRTMDSVQNCDSYTEEENSPNRRSGMSVRMEMNLGLISAHLAGCSIKLLPFHVWNTVSKHYLQL